MNAPAEIPHDQLADERDTLDWSWDRLTDGERTEDTDDDVLGLMLFAGVPPEQVEAHREALIALGGGA